GFLMRGAISKGWQIHDANIAIGQAQVRAVELEEDKAIFPRVVISPDIATLFLNHPLVMLDTGDGYYFIDYLRYFPGISINDYLIPTLLEYRQLIENNLQDETITNAPKTLAKWTWLAERFDECLDFSHRYKSVTTKLKEIKKLL
ncbi:MAG: hypothetical protein ACK4PR_13430, partial [Gammaproteobacteria bacterium]